MNLKQNSIHRVHAIFRSTAMGVFAFSAAVLTSSSFELTSITKLSAEFWALAISLGILASWASWYFTSMAVVASLSVAFLAAYIADKVPSPKTHPLTLLIFIASAVGLLLHQKKHLFAFILIPLILIAYLLSIPISITCLLDFAFIVITSAFSFASALLLERAVSYLQPSFYAVATVLWQAASFLGFYIILALMFALIYHNIYLYDPKSFRIVSELDHTKLDLAYFVYWSFSVFISVGSGELSPATHLTRTVVVIQVLSGISWLTIFFALFMTSLTKQTIKHDKTI